MPRIKMLNQGNGTSKKLDDDDEEDDEQNFHLTISFNEFSNITRFSYFALAAYSTLMFLYMHPCSGCCSLLCAPSPAPPPGWGGWGCPLGWWTPRSSE